MGTCELQGWVLVGPEFPTNDVEQLIVKQPAAQMFLGKKDDIWVVHDRGDYPANFDNIREFILKICGLKVKLAPEVGASQLPRMELTTNGTLVEFKDKNGKLLSSLLLGMKHLSEGKAPGGGYPDGRYVMVGSDIKTVAVVSDSNNGDPFSNAEAKPEEWLNKDFLHVNNLKSISVTATNATNNWKVFRDKENGDWILADPKKDEKLDPMKTSVLNNVLASASFADVATNTAPEQTGLDKPVSGKVGDVRRLCLRCEDRQETQ